MYTLICQYLYGEEIGKYATSHYSEEWNQNAFLWGIQGYEFLIFHRFLFWQSGIKLASCVECFNKVGMTVILEETEYYLQQHTSSILKIYCLGQKCREILKQNTEPFIKYGLHMLIQEYPNEQVISLRNKIETSLDIIMLRYLRNQLPVEFDMKQIFPKDATVQREIAKLYSYLLEKLLDDRQETAVLLQATKDARKTCGMFNDRTTFKKNFFERMERGKEHKCRLSSCFRGISEGDAYDYANIYHAQWSLEDGSICTKSYIDLFEFAVEQSKQIIYD